MDFATYSYVLILINVLHGICYLRSRSFPFVISSDQALRTYHQGHGIACLQTKHFLLRTFPNVISSVHANELSVFHISLHRAS